MLSVFIYKSPTKLYMQCGFNITETKAKSSDFQLVFQHDTVKQKQKNSSLPHSAFGEVKNLRRSLLPPLDCS